MAHQGGRRGESVPPPQQHQQHRHEHQQRQHQPDHNHQPHPNRAEAPSNAAHASSSHQHAPRHMHNQPAIDLASRIHNPARETLLSLPGVLPDLALPESSQLLRQQEGDASSSEDDFTTGKRPRRPPHSRSMSHPFPSLFSRKKRHDASAAAGDMSDEELSEDDLMLLSSRKQNLPAAGKKGEKATVAMGNKDFVSGNCMTCGSLVKWPKSLSVFKCTICMTINDLVCLDTSKESEMRRNRAASRSNSPPKAGHRAQSISIEHTKKLIRQCIYQFLKDRQDERASQAMTPESDGAQSSHQVADDQRAWGKASAAEEARKKARLSRYPLPPQKTSMGYSFEEEPTLKLSNRKWGPRSYSSSLSERPRINQSPPQNFSRPSVAKTESPEDKWKKLFKPLEHYIISCITSFECLNSSFASRPGLSERARSESTRRQQAAVLKRETVLDPALCDVDPKLLLLGDFAENGFWWTGAQPEAPPARSSSHRSVETTSSVSVKSPQIDWLAVRTWYELVLNAAEPWRRVLDELAKDACHSLPEDALGEWESLLLKAQDHVQRTLLKATEVLLKRPGRLMESPENLRFLFIVFENPLLRQGYQCFRGNLQLLSRLGAGDNSREEAKGRLTGAPHSGITRRVLGLISNASSDCQNHLVTWLARLTSSHFAQIKDIVSSFLTHRLIRDNERKHETKVDVMAGLIPSMSTGRSPASLHAALGTRSKYASKEAQKKMMCSDDWQIRAACRVMALLFAANNSSALRRSDGTQGVLFPGSRDSNLSTGQLLPTHDFYNTLLDFADLVADFEAWEARRGKFSFCQYPFLLSMWAKTQILEFDAKRQMESKARDAFFDSIMSHKNVQQHLVLDVRRDCLVEDSLKAVSEIIGSGSEDIKKALRIIFRGEEGVDAGGLRKEWFLLLVREVFNPDHGMFVYDEDSQYCYFNPHSFETSDQFFLVGVVMGLAIYNSTILDVALPPFAFRKLLAAAPAPTVSSSAHPRPLMSYTLDDLAEYRPRLAQGLRQLLEYEGDVETVFCLDFSVDVEKYGSIAPVSLCLGGEAKPVTNSNRREYVDLYVRYLLDGSVVRQFEPFKRGFFTVCGGNALSLFRPEEIELLIRGSDEALDIASLRAVAEYDNWGSRRPDGLEPTVEWFWQTFEDAAPKDQRKLLSFITGSDRIPAAGAATLPIKLSCLGDDIGRYPIARTCFNTLALSRYDSRERLEVFLWRAVHESEGFGLK